METWLRFICLVVLVVPGRVFADSVQFDLAGPNLEVKVVHAGKTLPISAVPNLSVGDQVSIKADLPPGQSAHYLLVAAFLRGATNPPPENWFFSSETWNPKDSGGLKITVPEGAQQVLVFLAPETGGDFKTLVSAVRGRPGAFVRASQDLNQATLDRSRLKAYLAAVQTRLGQCKEARKILEHEIAANTNATRAVTLRWQLAEACEKDGDTAKAGKVLSEAAGCAKGTPMEPAAQKRLAALKQNAK